MRTGTALMIVLKLFEITAVLCCTGAGVGSIMHENIIHLRQRISRSGIFIYREEILRPVRVRCVSLRRQSLDPSPHGILSPFSHLLRHIYCFHRCAGFRSTGRHLQKLCQCDDSYQNSCTKQSHPDISADSCPSAATLSLRPRQALSCARVVGIVSAYVSIRYSNCSFLFLLADSVFLLGHCTMMSLFYAPSCMSARIFPGLIIHQIRISPHLRYMDLCLSARTIFLHHIASPSE